MVTELKAPESNKLVLDRAVSHSRQQGLSLCFQVCPLAITIPTEIHMSSEHYTVTL